jgi:hypothetical protein
VTFDSIRLAAVSIRPPDWPIRLAGMTFEQRVDRSLVAVFNSAADLDQMLVAGTALDNLPSFLYRYQHSLTRKTRMIAVIDYKRFLEEQITIQRRAIARWKLWALLLVGGGILIFAAGQIVGALGVAGTEMMKLAGAFVGTVAVFPYREITPREERIATYNVLLGGVGSYAALSADEQLKLIAVITDAMMETLKR